MRRLALLASIVGLSACDAAPPPAIHHVERPTLDKRALYGDAALLPTREGERVRRELALAGELSEALALLELTERRVDVELSEPPQVIVVAHTRVPTPELAAKIDALGRAIVPGDPDVHVELLVAAPPQPSAPTHDWPLALVCLGLGLSLGVTGERLRARTR